MKERLIGILNRTRNSAHFIRAIVGAYVAYSCGKVAAGYFTTDEVTLPMMLGAAAVALCGLGIALLSLWAIAKGYSIEYKGRAPWTIPADEEDETAELSEENEEAENESTDSADETEDTEE